MLVYPHPLDYVTGIKYTVTEWKLNMKYHISPETFNVVEIVDLDLMGFNKDKGEYIVIEMYKKDVETLKALDLLAKKLGIPGSNIHIYGLKDKNATTISHVFVKKTLVDISIFPLETSRVKFKVLGYVKSKPSRLFFKGNKFRVLIEDVDENNYHIFKKILDIILESGLPAYYGYQRFGYRRYHSHILGKYVLLGRIDLFAEELLETIYPLEETGTVYKRIVKHYRDFIYEHYYYSSSIARALDKFLSKTRQMPLYAYSSYLFNLLLNELIENRGLRNLPASLPMPGCSSGADYYINIACIEEIDPVFLGKLPCSWRDSVFKPVDNAFTRVNNSLIYEFTLKPGMYATIVLRELFKDNLLLGK